MDICTHLSKIYGEAIAKENEEAFMGLLVQYKTKIAKQEKKPLTEKDIVLITYADQFRRQGEKALETFAVFADSYLKDIFSVIHFLPFYPYSSDDGFSVINYLKIKEEFGSWEDLAALGKDFKLMYDFVCNHVSAKSEWFTEYLKGDKEYDDFFICADPAWDLTEVTRPRALPLLTKFNAAGTERYIWTTFSRDQIDLNFGNPKVLYKIIDILLAYIEKGASWIRLDAVGFIWKEIGTACINHVKAHEIVKLFHTVIDEVAPNTRLITETNVPHAFNIAYFGNGSDESHMVYQFPLPPLVLYSFLKENGKVISKWASEITVPSDDTSYFNFLASHDGIGVNPIRGIVPEEEILSFINILQKESDALVSYKENPDGTQSPYEINVSYLSAIGGRIIDDKATRKFITAQAILLSFIGVPAVYVHSLIGSQNYKEGVEKTGQNRSVNREKNDLNEIKRALEHENNIRHTIFTALKRLIGIRKSFQAFSPSARQEILELSPKALCFLRQSEDGQRIMCMYNFSGEPLTLVHKLFVKPYDIVEEILIATENSAIELDAYAFKWLLI